MVFCPVISAMLPQREKLAAEVTAPFPDIDILVNNAGIKDISTSEKGAYSAPKAGGDEIAVNFTSLVDMTGASLSNICLQNTVCRGFINVSSGLGFMPMPNTPVYSAYQSRGPYLFAGARGSSSKGTQVKVT